MAMSTPPTKPLIIQTAGGMSCPPSKSPSPSPSLTLDALRSSVTNRLAAMADVGGVNSFRSFARSWQRAVGFAEVIPRRPSFVLAHEHPSQEDIQYGRSHVEHRPSSARGRVC